MRLTRLNIKGFKSFADETEIHFNENLIGIVGPNGSGKSNVVDAIRWVLGEQKTSELRLENMTDVIFNGSKARKEGKVARVTLSFENTKNLLPTEYNEVRISRILYRDGTSEYRLNDVICRKKDITSLFIDSGIGSNSYAIISLNMVEDILHDNGGYRRSMIEQAAGIAKYKIRKKETEQKLKGTEEDLDRIEDILHEIKKNMSSFERQARRTEKYNRLKGDYRDITIRLSKQEIVSLRNKVKELTKIYDDTTLLRLHINTELSNKEAVLQALKADIIESEKRLSTDQHTYNKLLEDLGSNENAKNLSLQTIRTSSDFLNDIDKNRAELQTTKENATKHLTVAEHQIQTLQIEVGGKQEQLTKIDQRLQSSSQLLADLRRKEREMINQINSNQNLRNSITRELESLKAKKILLETDVQELNARKSQARTELASLQQQMVTAQKELDTTMSTLQKSEASLEELLAKSEKAVEDLNLSQKRKNQLDVDLSSVEQRIRFMSNIIEKNEGVPEAVKFALKESTSQKLILFSDIMAIKQERFAKLIEFFLEPLMHCVISPSREEAEKLTTLVKQGQKGRLQLLISEEIPSITSKTYDGLLALSDALSVEKGMETMAKWVTKDVYISEERYSSDYCHSFNADITILFPLEYKIWAKGKSYGGSPTLFEGVQLGRKQLLEKLEKEKEKITSNLADQEQKVIQCKQTLNDRQQLLAQARRSEQETRQLVENANRKLFQLKSQQGNIESNVAYHEKQEAEKGLIGDKVASELIIQQNRLAEIEANHIDDLKDSELALKIEEISADNILIGQEKERVQRELFEWRGKLDLAKKDQQYYQNTLASIEERFIKMMADLQVQRTKREEAEAKLAEVTTVLESLYDQKRTIQSQLSDHEDSYYKKKGDIFELEKEVSTNRSQLGSKDQSIAQTAEQLARFKFDLQSIIDRNTIEFGIQLDELALDTEESDQEESGAMSMVEMRKEREQLREKIQSYGDINPMAITAYNEIKERYDQIEHERNDVLEAKNNLKKTIAEIERTASDLFHDALVKIRENFQDVFQSLFSEDDNCDIVLLDNENPLEAKVEIIAKPKGKKPKTISQLSGGEKTLTAASFLFALYLLKPAPFCIFDEVDAPLDDVNIQKFNKIIRQFSKDSQFIVITHNKLTMAEVDVLYGVYLKEQGVSGLSAVDFRSYEAAEILTSEN